MAMTDKDALKQGERGLRERIEHKGDDRTTDEKLFEELFNKTHEFGNLVAEHHAEINRLLSNERNYIRKLKVALGDYKRAMKK